MPILFRAIEINSEGNTTEPVQYVGTYVLRWPAGVVPQVGFVEAECPSLDRIDALMSDLQVRLDTWICPGCGLDGLERMTNHQAGKCSLYNRYLDAKDNLGVLEKFASTQGA